MDAPKELSFDEILKFMIAHNGKVTNHELVNHFKVFLMNPHMRDEARSTFKKHVNTLVIIKNQNNEKWLILKKKYLPDNSVEKEEKHSNNATESSSSTFVQNEESNKQELMTSNSPPPVQVNEDVHVRNNTIQNISESPTITKAESIDSVKENIIQEFEDTPPKLLPRSKSSDKCTSEKFTHTALGHRSSILNQDSLAEAFSPTLTASRSESMLLDNEQKISVKERKQMFNRMASESDVLKSSKVSGNLSNSSVDEEDRASQKGDVDPLDSKQKSWILCAARGEYHALAKMCKENAKLVKTKDPFTTAMHWACKRGDENLVKLLAGVHRHVVNERSGYTPLHIAMQFRHENVYRLLVEVYDADPNVRDWSGRKPRQYLVHMDTTMSPGTYRKSDLNVRRRTVEASPSIKVSSNNVQSPTKKESFLRIGSLNVRVKKTTEAFSNFLGVGATRSSAYMPKSGRDRDGDRRSDDGDHIHKSWGSADNIQKEVKLMPPPNSSKVRRRGASGRKGIGSHSRSTPSTPDQPRAQIGTRENGDSDSDSAAGFHSSWRQQRASCT